MLRAAGLGAGRVWVAVALLAGGCAGAGAEARVSRPVSSEVRDAYATLCEGVLSKVPEVRVQAALARANWVLDATLANALEVDGCNVVGVATADWLRGLKLGSLDAAAAQVESDFGIAGEPEKARTAASLLRTVGSGCTVEVAAADAGTVDGWRSEREAAVLLARLDWEQLPAAIRAGGGPLLSRLSTLTGAVARSPSQALLPAASKASLERHRAALARLAVVVSPTLDLADATLQLPVMLAPITGEVPPAETMRLRTVAVRSTGVQVALAQVEVACEAPGGSCRADEPLGFAWPGRWATRFEGEGAISPEAIEGDRVPALTAAMEELDRAVATAPWATVEQQRGPGGVLEGVSVVADGNLYYGSFQPIVRTLLAGGWSPVVLHTLTGKEGRLSAAPIRFVEKAPEGTGRILIRTDGYIIEPALGTDAKSEMVPWTAQGSLLRLYRFFEAARSGAAAQKPWVIQVDDAATDVGILVHLVSAISYRRTLDAAGRRDRSLLEAPLVLRDGLPEPLWPGGFVIEL